MNTTNAGLGLEANPSQDLMYVEAYGLHAATFEINVQFYVGMWLLLSFGRTLLSFTVTRSLGPIVSTILVMFNDVAQFIAIWFFVLIGFSTVGFVTFQEVPSLRKFTDSLTYFMQASFGSFDLTVFDDAYLPDRPDLNRIAIYFVLLYVFLNLIILINVVIAMMADTYGYMTSQKLGIYSHSVIKAAPAYT